MKHLCLTMIFAISALGCKTPTQFVVYIDSDLEPGTELERIVVLAGEDKGEELSPDDDEVQMYEFRVVAEDPIGASRRTLPVSFAVVPAGDLPRDARIEATGYLTLSGARTVTDRALSSFRSNQALGITLRLDEECVGVVCEPSFSCERGACVDAIVSDPPEVSGELRPCGVDERVSENACVSCPTGTRNRAGDDASGPDTMCDAIICARDEQVVEHECLVCPTGTLGDGNDASGPDTMCAVVICGADERVVGNECVACPRGSTNEPGDDASGGDTNCDATLCAETEFVSDNTCETCPAGMMNAAGDDASATDTTCEEGDLCFQALQVRCEVFNQAYIKAPSADPSSAFGASVALSSDGETLAVGVISDGSSSTGIDGDYGRDDARGSGAVYVFVRRDSTWVRDAYIKASNTDSFDEFGWSVALSSDGRTLAVGARGEDSAATGIDGDQESNDASGSGAVYVFQREGMTWAQEAYIKASNTDDDGSEFGRSVTLSGDGGILGVGAFGEASTATGIDGDQASNDAEESGAVYVFKRTGLVWVQEAYIKASNTNRSDAFGWSVALSSDGRTLAVGALGEDSVATGTGGDQESNGASGSGAVYVFQREGTAWAQEAYIKASNTGAMDRFGSSVGLSLDGGTLVVGAPAEDSSSRGTDGEQESDSATNSGAAYVFTRAGAVWTQEVYIKASNAHEDDAFGYSVTLSSDGETLVVGAHLEASNATGVDGDQTSHAADESGAVYLFTRSETWSQEAYIKASNTDEQDGFGRSLALSSDGQTLAVGAPQEDSASTGVGGDQTSNAAEDSGAVYLRQLAP